MEGSEGSEDLWQVCREGPAGLADGHVPIPSIPFPVRQGEPIRAVNLPLGKHGEIPFSRQPVKLGLPNLQTHIMAEETPASMPQPTWLLSKLDPISFAICQVLSWRWALHFLSTRGLQGHTYLVARESLVSAYLTGYCLAELQCFSSFSSV